jgi:hypothetical protein
VALCKVDYESIGFVTFYKPQKSVFCLAHQTALSSSPGTFVADFFLRFDLIPRKTKAVLAEPRLDGNSNEITVALWHN